MFGHAVLCPLGWSPIRASQRPGALCITPREFFRCEKSALLSDLTMKMRLPILYARQSCLIVNLPLPRAVRVPLILLVLSEVRTDAFSQPCGEGWREGRNCVPLAALCLYTQDCGACMKGMSVQARSWIPRLLGACGIC